MRKRFGSYETQESVLEYTEILCRLAGDFYAVQCAMHGAMFLSFGATISSIAQRKPRNMVQVQVDMKAVALLKARSCV